MRTLTRSKRRQRLESRAGVDAVMTSFALPRALHREVAVTVLDLNWTFAGVTRAALQEWLRRHRGTR